MIVRSVGNRPVVARAVTVPAGSARVNNMEKHPSENAVSVRVMADEGVNTCQSGAHGHFPGP